MASSSTPFLHGFGFCPNNSEIVTLLSNKEEDSTFNVEGCTTIKFYDYHPEQLPRTNSGNEKTHYFAPLSSKHARGNVINRQTPSQGCWKMTGSSKKIENESAEEKSFKFVNNGKQTGWLMKEYTLLTQNKIPQWAFCVVYYKR